MAGADARAQRAQNDAALAERITAIHREFDGTYGCPRVTAELAETGTPVNHKRVARVMRARGSIGLHLGKKARTTISEPNATPVPLDPITRCCNDWLNSPNTSRGGSPASAIN